MDFDLLNFRSDLDKLEIKLSEQQINQFMDYYNILVEWNSFMNLTTITDFNDVCKKHFIDSLSFIKVFKDINVNSESFLSIIDVGTGAGFPGIPLKIVFPNFNIVLLDSLNKRIKFLNTVIDTLQLKNVTAVHSRAEDYAKTNCRESFDVCVSRAVANLSTLSEYCLPFVKVGGYFVPYKTDAADSEVSFASHAMMILGGKILEQKKFYLPNSEIFRNLVVIQKIKSVSKKYPRKAGLPSKEPL